MVSVLKRREVEEWGLVQEHQGVGQVCEPWGGEEEEEVVEVGEGDRMVGVVGEVGEGIMPSQ